MSRWSHRWHRWSDRSSSAGNRLERHTSAEVFHEFSSPHRIRQSDGNQKEKCSNRFRWHFAVKNLHLLEIFRRHSDCHPWHTISFRSAERHKISCLQPVELWWLLPKRMFGHCIVERWKHRVRHRRFRRRLFWEHSDGRSRLVYATIDWSIPASYNREYRVSHRICRLSRSKPVKKNRDEIPNLIFERSVEKYLRLNVLQSDAFE